MDKSCIMDFTTVGAYHVANEARGFFNFPTKMTEDFGKTINPYHMDIRSQTKNGSPELINKKNKSSNEQLKKKGIIFILNCVKSLELIMSY